MYVRPLDFMKLGSAIIDVLGITHGERDAIMKV